MNPFHHLHKGEERYLQLKHFTILSPQGPVVTDNSNFIVDCLFDKVGYYLGIFSALD